MQMNVEKKIIFSYIPWISKNLWKKKSFVVWPDTFFGKDFTNINIYLFICIRKKCL